MAPLRAALALTALAAATARRLAPAGPAANVLAPGGAAGEHPWASIKIGDDVPADGCQSLGAVSDGQGGLVLHSAKGAGSEAGQFLALGSFADSLERLGWSSLSMQISEATTNSDRLKMYAAGVVEGFLTARRIREFYHNSRGLLDLNPDNRPRLPRLQEALQRSVSSFEGSSSVDELDPFATQAQLTFLQTWGIRDGYALAAGHVASMAEAPGLSMVDMFILNSDGVIDEYLTKYGEGPGAETLLQRAALREPLRHAPAQRRAAGRRGHRRAAAGHCTGLVRLTEDKSELYFGHTTWEAFSEMTRIWKVYDFPLSGVSARKISFSSYPGCVSSTDDYYLMDSGLAITETTLNIPAKQNYPTTTGVPDFMRIMASNRIAGDGEAWVRSMVDSSTGTYSSQWLVVDYKKFVPGSDLSAGTFFVLEQAPGVSHYEDMSARLQHQGYWASFDRAFFDEVRESTGDTATEASLRSTGGAEAAVYSKSNTPRAQIVRHTIHNVASLATMREEMTRNMGSEDQVEPAALRLPRFAISARNDLRGHGLPDPDGSPDGGVDAKVTSACLFRKLTAEAISSPSHVNMPPFQWESADGQELWPGYPHEGLPNTATFGWLRMDPGRLELSPLVSDTLCA